MRGIVKVVTPSKTIVVVSGGDTSSSAIVNLTRSKGSQVKLQRAWQLTILLGGDTWLYGEISELLLNHFLLD